LRSMSSSSSPRASFTRSPVTAISPNNVEQVHPRSPYADGSRPASATIRRDLSIGIDVRSGPARPAGY
jgi:hypothetical protein